MPHSLHSKSCSLFKKIYDFFSSSQKETCGIESVVTITLILHLYGWNEIKICRMPIWLGHGTTSHEIDQ